MPLLCLLHRCIWLGILRDVSTYISYVLYLTSYPAEHTPSLVGVWLFSAAPPQNGTPVLQEVQKIFHYPTNTFYLLPVGLVQVVIFFSASILHCLYVVLYHVGSYVDMYQVVLQNIKLPFGHEMIHAVASYVHCSSTSNLSSPMIRWHIRQFSSPQIDVNASELNDAPLILK